MKKIIIGALIVATSFYAWAQKDAEPLDDKPPILKFGDESNENVERLPLVPTHLKKGKKIEVLEYDTEHDAFSVAYPEESEQGPFYFTPDELIRGTGFSINPKEFSKQKKVDFVGSEHVLKSDIRMLEEDEFKARAKR